MNLKSTTKIKLSSTILFLGLIIICSSFPFTKAWAGSYRTDINSTSNWDVPASWEVWNNSTWVQATSIPTSSDDVTINRSINVPNSGTSLNFYCNTLSIVSSSSDNKVLLLPGVILNVKGNVVLNSPSSATITNTFDVGQGNLFIDGYLIFGNNTNNSNKGTVKVIVRGGASSFGTLKVKENIYNNSNSTSPAPCNIEVSSYGVLEAYKGISLGTKLSATFSANTTLRFAGNVAQTLPTGIIYGNINIANSAGVTLSEDLSSSNLLGNLIVESGVLLDGGYAISGRAVKVMEVWNGAKLDISYSNPSSNPNLNGTAFPSGFSDIILEPASTVVYSAGGTITQKIAQPLNGYGNLEFRGGPTSAKKLLSNITARNVLVDANVFMDLGYINIGNNTLTLMSNGSITNSDASHYIVMDSQGKMLVEGIGPGGRTAEVIFPIGTTTSYTPAYLKNTGSIQSFSVGISDGVKDYASNQVLNYHIVNKTWNISQETSGGIPNVDVRLQWNTSDEGINFKRTACYVTHYINNAWSKEDIFQDATRSNMSAKMTGVTSFSPFSVADGGNPLPVELVFFKAAKQDNGVALTWETASEKNNNGYDIQASTDGRHFEFVGYVASKNGNANYSQRYEFLDKTSRSGLVYYRLKQTDFDGTVAYYAAKVVDMGKFTESVSAYPNPFRDQFEIKLQAAAAQDVLLQITDMAGKTVYRNAPKVLAGQNVIPVTFENNLPAGLYILTAKTATQVYTTRIVKQ